MRASVLAAAIAALVSTSVMADEWYVEVRYPDSATLARAAAKFQHVEVDAKRQVLKVATDDDGIAELEALGLAVQIDQEKTARIREFQARLENAIRNQEKTVTAGNYAAIPGFPCFRTVEGTYQTMDDLKAAHPAIVAIDEIGPSWQRTQNATQGYLMRALRITNLATAANDPDRPKMVLFGSIHAREYAPAEVVTRFAEWLANHYGTDPEATWLVDHNDFRLVLQANPDGRKKAETGVLWRKNVNNVTAPCSAQTSSQHAGVDLNRNFPFHWHIVPGDGGSSSSLCAATYRGPVKGSEPETQNLVQYVIGTCDAAGVCTGGALPDRRVGAMNPPSAGMASEAAAPDDTKGLFIDIHSNADMLIWPWGDSSNPAPNQAALRTFGRRVAYYNGYTPQQSATLYPTDGATDDNMYSAVGVPTYTMELDGQFFQSCSSFESTTAVTNVAALRYAARNLQAAYVLPAGPDALNIAVQSATVIAGSPILLTASIDDTRFNQSTAVEPVIGTVRNIASAAAYVDRLPWQAGAVPIPLTAADGAFNTPTENVSGSISSAGLSPGRHLIYVQGKDVAGNAGTPNAVFVTVLANDVIFQNGFEGP